MCHVSVTSPHRHLAYVRMRRSEQSLGPPVAAPSLYSSFSLTTIATTLKDGQSIRRCPHPCMLFALCCDCLLLMILLANRLLSFSPRRRQGSSQDAAVICSSTFSSPCRSYRRLNVNTLFLLPSHSLGYLPGHLVRSYFLPAARRIHIIVTQSSMLSGLYTRRCKLKNAMVMVASTVRLSSLLPTSLSHTIADSDVGNGTYEPLYGQPGGIAPAQAPVNYGATGNYVR